MFCQGGGCSVMAVPWQYRGSTKGTVFQYCGTASVLPWYCRDLFLQQSGRLWETLDINPQPMDFWHSTT